jgi:hypothetical protein
MAATMSNDLESLRAALAKQHRGARRAFVVIIVLALAFISTSLYAFTSRAPAPWTPIGDLPTQDVLNPNNSVAADGLLLVRGTKCFDELPVRIAGSQTWRSVNPAGITVEMPGSSRVFDPANPEPGDVWDGNCVTRNYSNEVADKVRDWFTHGLVEWELTGEMIPKRAHGSDGVSRFWSTETIVLTSPKGQT